MKVGTRPENALEWVALRLDLGPVPLADTQVAYTAARAIMAGTSLGLFVAIDDGATTPDAIATACGTDARATRTLLDCLVGLEYLRLVGGRYRNTRRAEKWLLARSPTSLRAKLVFQEVEWQLLGRLEEFVRTGKGLDMHQALEPRSWELYQEAMRALAASAAPIVARRLPLPRRPVRLLDIGGSHGLYSVALCKKYPTLRAEILELPDALPRAAAILAREGMGDRVKHRAGNALADDLGDGELDVVVVNNLVHHFTAEQNEALARRVARALRPGGVFAIGDVEKTEGGGGAVGGTMDLYFALTSTSGTWRVAEMRGWQRNAGLAPLRPIRDPRMPGYVLQVARRT